LTTSFSSPWPVLWISWTNELIGLLQCQNCTDSVAALPEDPPSSTAGLSRVRRSW
jgi:hypothetical protein